MNKKWGYLRETKEDAIKAGIDKKYNIGRTGLEEYLEVIFPEVKDWIHDKTTGIYLDGKKFNGRPDYRSEKLKMIIEFDGLPHYKNPDVIINDEIKNTIYEEAGYKVIRSHIDEGKNFFYYEPEEHYDVIISNPPFSCKDDVLKRLYELDKPYAMLLPIPALQG